MRWRSTLWPLIFWAGGMLLLRKRWTSKNQKIVFTVGMFAMATLDFVTDNNVLILPRITPLFSILFCLVMVVTLGFRFHRWGQTRAFVPLAIAVSIMILSTPWWGSITHTALFAMFAAAGLLILISLFLMHLNKHDSRPGKPGP